MGKQNIFRVLGLYGKETVVSNLLAWLIDPEEDHELGLSFTNDFLNSLGCEQINSKNKVIIYREYYGKQNQKNNFIDIVIIEKDEHEQIIHVIGIENKVFSKEGCNQTQRYWGILKNDFYSSECNIECRYLTKSNLPVELSNSNFKHYKYCDLEDVLNKYSNNKFVKDFYQSYVLLDKNKLAKLELLTLKEYSEYFNIIDFQRDLCFYVTQKFIYSKSDIYCEVSNSAKGGEPFYKVWKQSWNKIINNINFNVHIEGYGEKIYVHFETNLYIPYSKLEENIKATMNQQRELLREKLKQIQLIDCIERKAIRKNAHLTIGNFRVKYSSFKEYYNYISELVEYIDPIVLNIESNKGK